MILKTSKYFKICINGNKYLYPYDSEVFQYLHFPEELTSIYLLLSRAPVLNLLCLLTYIYMLFLSFFSWVKEKVTTCI